MRKIRTQSLHFFIFDFSVSSHHGGASLWSSPNIRFGKIWRKFQGELTGYQAVSILAACYQPVSAISQVSALAIDWRGDDGRHIRSQVSHFFPFQIRTSPSKAFLRDFPLFSNGSLFFSPDNLYKKLDWLGLCRKRPGFETIEVDSAVATWGWKFPSENKEFFVEPSQHFFREFETNYNYTGSLCWFPLLSHNWWWNHWGVRRRKYFCLQNLSPLLSQEVILSNISPDHFSP